MFIILSILAWIFICYTIIFIRTLTVMRRTLKESTSPHPLWALLVVVHKLVVIRVTSFIAKTLDRWV
jgi:hypothetical protein